MRRLRKLSRVPNVSNPSIADKIVLELIKNSGNSINDDSERVSTGTGDNDQGSVGFWSLDEENKVVYYNEIYSFVHNGLDFETFLISWVCDDNGKLDKYDGIVTNCGNNAAVKVLNNCQSGMTLSNGFTIKGEYKSFDDANK